MHKTRLSYGSDGQRRSRSSHNEECRGYCNNDLVLFGLSSSFDAGDVVTSTNHLEGTLTHQKPAQCSLDEDVSKTFFDSSENCGSKATYDERSVEVSLIEEDSIHHFESVRLNQPDGVKESSENVRVQARASTTSSNEKDSVTSIGNPHQTIGRLVWGESGNDWNSRSTVYKIERDALTDLSMNKEKKSRDQALAPPCCSIPASKVHKTSSWKEFTDSTENSTSIHKLQICPDADLPSNSTKKGRCKERIHVKNINGKKDDAADFASPYDTTTSVYADPTTKDPINIHSKNMEISLKGGRNKKIAPTLLLSERIRTKVLASAVRFHAYNRSKKMLIRHGVPKQRKKKCAGERLKSSRSRTFPSNPPSLPRKKSKGDDKKQAISTRNIKTFSKMQEVTRTNNLKGEKVKYEIIPTPPCLFYTVVAAGSSCSSISTISNVSASKDTLRSRRLQQNAVTRSAKRRSYVKSASDALKNPGRRKAFQHSEKNSEKLFASTGIARKYAYEILRCQREWRKKNPTQQY